MVLRSALGERGAAHRVGIGSRQTSSQSVPRRRERISRWRDGVFFWLAVAKLDQPARPGRRHCASARAAVIALTGNTIRSSTTSTIDVVFGLTGASLLVFRARVSSESRGALPDGVRVPITSDDDGLRARLLGDFGVDDRAVSRECGDRRGHSAGWCRGLLAVGAADQSAQRSLSEDVLRRGRNRRVYRTM